MGNVRLSMMKCQLTNQLHNIEVILAEYNACSSQHWTSLFLQKSSWMRRRKLMKSIVILTYILHTTKKIQHAFCRIPVLFSYALSEEYLSNLNIILSAYLLFTDCQSVEIMLFGHEHNPCWPLLQDSYLILPNVVDSVKIILTF
jgi:hypothetical protein